MAHYTDPRYARRRKNGLCTRCEQPTPLNTSRKKFLGQPMSLCHTCQLQDKRGYIIGGILWAEKSHASHPHLGYGAEIKKYKDRLEAFDAEHHPNKRLQVNQWPKKWAKEYERFVKPLPDLKAPE